MESKQLRVDVASGEARIALNPWGGTVPFSNDAFEGQVFFAHRPPAGSKVPFEYEERLSKFGPPNWNWELQVHGRFKSPPRGSIWLAGELRDGPMSLNLVTRALSRTILKLLQQITKARGIPLRYSFGDGGEYPVLAVPVLTAADRLIVSDCPLQLPVDTSDAKGTWMLRDGVWSSIERSAVRLDPSCYVTIPLATYVADLSAWNLPKVPGVGSLNLESFWGKQGVHIVLYDDGDEGSGRRYFTDIALSALPDASPQQIDAETAKRPAQHDVAKTEQAEVEAADVVMNLADAEVEEPKASADNQDEQEVEDDKIEQDAAAFPELEARLLSFQRSILDESGKLVFMLDTSSMEDIQDRPFPTLACPAPCESSSGSPVEDDAVPQMIADSVVPDSEDEVSIPWYFRNGAGDLWWCIHFRGRSCWRHHDQLRDLCTALDPNSPQVHSKGSVSALESSRRCAASILREGCSAPGLLEEFTHTAVHLCDLLVGDCQPASDGIWMGIVDLEGRIIERYVIFGEWMQWRVQEQCQRQMSHVRVDLKSAELTEHTVAGAPALTISTLQKSCTCVAKDDTHLEAIRRRIHLGPAVGNNSTGMQLSFPIAALQRACTRALPQAAIQASLPSLQRVAELVRTSHSPKAAHVHRPLKDHLFRLPKNRLVINDSDLHIGVPAPEPLGLSAGLLRDLLTLCHDAPSLSTSSYRRLSQKSAGLKCVKLSSLNPQELWSFWVNVFHSLVVHSQLICGRPNSFQQIVSFFNKNSYIVAGHVFSLAEIEHCILRHFMSKPRIQLMKFIIRIWPRTDAELESRPCTAAPYAAAACFRCRPDWRINLVLSAGNYGSSDAIPVFEARNNQDFEEILHCAVTHSLAVLAHQTKDSIELPYSLYRYRDDAPECSPGDGHERRWLHALSPYGVPGLSKISYCRDYEWKMRGSLSMLSNEAKISL